MRSSNMLTKIARITTLVLAPIGVLVLVLYIRLVLMPEARADQAEED